MRSNGAFGELIVVAVCLLAVGALAAPALAATDPAADGGGAQQAGADGEPAPAFDVAVQPDGTGELRVVYTFDLTDDSRAEAFASLQRNDTTTAAFEARFRQRLERVAADASAATDREMRIEGVEATSRSAGETGVVTVSATWRGLAAVEDDRLVVTEPFASGFEPDRAVHLQVPDGYAVTDASPSPTNTDGGRVTWAAGTDLSGFAVAMEATAAGTEGSSGPGFGVVAAIVGIVATLVAAGRRR